MRVATFGVDVAAVQVDDPLGDGEAEAGATVAGRARGIGAVKALEDAVLLGFRDAGAFVDDLDGDAVGRSARARRCR